MLKSFVLLASIISILFEATLCFSNLVRFFPRLPFLGQNLKFVNVFCSFW